MRSVNLPPVWMLGFIALAWGLSRITAAGPGWLVWVGWALVAAGLALMIWAALQFRAARTTLVPHERPSALVNLGPYRLSRNPIYLADLLILAGVVLILRAPLGLGLLLPFQQVLLRLFILPEEAVLDRDLGKAYRDYKARVRRWI